MLARLLGAATSENVCLFSTRPYGYDVSVRILDFCYVDIEGYDVAPSIPPRHDGLSCPSHARGLVLSRLT
jgi:hypothetical protein